MEIPGKGMQWLLVDECMMTEAHELLCIKVA